MLFERTIKESTIKTILNMSNFLGRFEDDIVSFANRIWPLHEMPSTDERFKTAYEDLTQHLVNNSDWDYTFLFYERLKILEDESFNKFIEMVVNPEIRINKDEILQYVAIINNALSDTTYRLSLIDYFEGLPLYRLREKSALSDLPVDIAENTLIIYKREIKSVPCLLLTYDNWDDYGYKTQVDVEYFNKEGISHSIGRLKILKRGNNETWDSVPSDFTTLPNDFCSLGQSEGYYNNLKNILGIRYQSVTLALRDAALYPKFHEQFENDPIFATSLLRNNHVEKLLRTIRYKLNDLDLENCFVFNYLFTPPYSEDTLNLFFDFKYNTPFDHRIYALIGKNGTGKTRFLSNLAKDLSQRETVNIRPKRPLYAKVFTVSYSYFDRFEIPDGDAEFNYVYCGLKKQNGNWLNQEELMERFFASSKKIIEKNLTDEWYQTLHDFIPSDLLSMVFNVRNSYGQDKVFFSEENFGAFHQKLSSGQNILVYIISEILAQIRYNSLILYDEPETHLHPNAVSSLMFTLFNLVKRFDSFCIIATHSPIVIQEIPSRNIYIITRDDVNAEVRTLEKETFGENLTVITDEVFGNRSIAKHQYMILEDLVKSKKTYAEIIGILQSYNLPVSLNTRLIVKSLMGSINEES